MEQIYELISNENFKNFIEIINTILTLILTTTALYFTIKTYDLKKGQNIRGSYSTSRCIYCEDTYVHTVELENYKDKAIVIYNIYLKIGHNYYLELEDFESKPLILNPFEIYKKEYEPIDLYSISLTHVSIDKLFANKKVKKQIVLSTSNGKYKVRNPIKHWSPLTYFFKNHSRGIIRVDRSTYKGKSYGWNTKYIIDLKYSDGSEEVVPIYNNNFNRFRNFSITKDDIESKLKLEMLLNQMMLQEKLKCEEFKVIDIEAFRNELYSDYDMEKMELDYYNWFNHYIVARIITIYDNYKLNRENRKRKERRERLSSSSQSSQGS